MKVVEGACELYMMESGTPKTPLTVAELIAKKCMKTEPKCPLDNAATYIIEIKGYETNVKCPAHKKTLAEMIKAIEGMKNAKPPLLKNTAAAPAPPSPPPGAKKLAALKLFTEVFSKCCRDASVTIQATSHETTPPTKMTQTNYYKDPSNLRSDTVVGGQKVRMVISKAGSWIYTEDDGKLTPLPAQKAAEISSAMDMGALISRDSDNFNVSESKDKAGNILIYITNKATGVLNTYVIDPQQKVLKRVCIYPKKGVLMMDSIYGAWKFEKIDDKIFAVPQQAKTGTAK